MDGDRLLVDTNIVLYALQGESPLIEMLHGRDLYVSFITRIELLSFPKISVADIDLLERFLEQIPVVESNPDINSEATRLRRTYGLEVPDALIAASARYLGVRLLSADREFKKVEEEIDLLLYTL